MSWLDFAFGVASRAAKNLHAEFEAGRKGQPAPTKPKRNAAPRNLREPEGPSWRAVLGVSAGASWREVTAAYRELITKNHPDKVAHLSERIRKVAEEETRRINAAYEAAQAALGKGKKSR